MRGPKIVFIGAGSTMFAKLLVCDIFSHPALSNSTIVLEDIDEEKLELTYRLSSLILEKFRLNGIIMKATDQKKALKDADVVISMIAVGGNEAWEIDKNIPLKHGVDQIVGDTLGPGGIFRGLRHINVLTNLCSDMESICPDALLINYANPMAAIMWALNKVSGLKKIGLCHSVQATTKEIAGYIGITEWENYPVINEDWHEFYYRPLPGNVNFYVAGINHMAWYLKYEIDGKDAYPLIFKAYNNPKAYKADTVRFELLKHFGYFVTESPHHVSEYLPYFRRNKNLIDKYMSYTWNALEIIKSKSKLDDALVNRQLEGKGDIKLEKSVEYGSDIINSIVTGKTIRINGNVENTGLITNLLMNCCVEVPCLVDKNGISPCFVGDLPPQLSALNMSNINVQGLIVEAALRRSKEIVKHAAMTDPLTASVLTLDEISLMIEEMFEAQNRWLQGYK